MFWKKEDKPFIRFRHREDHEMIDKPMPANKFLPEWYKKLPRVYPEEHKNSPGTAKRCIPMLDACSQGYIIPSWCDWHISVGEDTTPQLDDQGKEVLDENGEVVMVKGPAIAFRASGNIGMPEMIGGHAWRQAGKDCPAQNYPVGKVIMKFINPWVIETAPGWSCHFKALPNHFNNINIIEGVVDTDTYRRQINFPFFWNGCEQGEFEIKRGDPLIHVIPFKREKIDLQYDVWDHDRMTQMDRMHETHFIDKYRKLWWHKRNGS